MPLLVLLDDEVEGRLFLHVVYDDGIEVVPQPQPEREGVPLLQLARRAFPEAQRLLDGSVTRTIGTVDVGWHDTAADSESGAFAVARLGGPYEDLVGNVLRVTVEDRSVIAYVVGRADVPTDLSLARRAFWALSILAAESVSGTVEVIE